MVLTLNVNGDTYPIDVDPQKPLLWVLREDIGLCGTKYACGIGICGSCIVLLDGVAVRSCVVTAGSVGSRPITTIEGLDDDLAHVVKDAWLAENVSQCGYCQPGQIMAAYYLLSNNPDPTDIDIEESMTNLCRCGTYQRIREAIKRAATELRQQ
jgi:isoquinoline 1-oxidoreductase alpha subunit